MQGIPKLYCAVSSNGSATARLVCRVAASAQRRVKRRPTAGPARQMIGLSASRGRLLDVRLNSSLGRAARRWGAGYWSVQAVGRWRWRAVVGKFDRPSRRSSAEWAQAAATAVAAKAHRNAGSAWEKCCWQTEARLAKVGCGLRSEAMAARRSRAVPGRASMPGPAHGARAEPNCKDLHGGWCAHPWVAHARGCAR